MQVQLFLGNILSTVTNPDPTILQLLDNALAVKADNTWHSKAYKDGRWDGMYRLFNKRARSFPSGLYPLVRKTLESNGYSVGTHNGRTGTKAPELEDLSLDLIGITPRDDQLIAARNAIRATRGLISSCTGSGKTAIMSILCQNIPGNILILTHTKTLLDQTAKAVSALTGLKVGKVGGGKHDERRITVCTIQSIQKLTPSWGDAINAVIVDECHHAGSKTYYNALNKIDCLYRYGFSADPTDNSQLRVNSRYTALKIHGVFGPCIHDFSTEQATEQGILAKADIRLITIDEKGYESASYQDAYDGLVAHSDVFNNKVVDLCKEHSDKQILILVKKIEHGKRLSKALAVGVRGGSRFLAGSDSSPTRVRVLADFEGGRTRVLVGSNIFVEGVDLPCIDIMINAGGDVAPTKQRLGRAVRKKYGKDNKVIVYDFYVAGNKYLSDHADKRVLIYRKDGHTVTKV